jgi:hypothetical protein
MGIQDFGYSDRLGFLIFQLLLLFTRQLRGCLFYFWWFLLVLLDQLFLVEAEINIVETITSWQHFFP